MNHPNFIILFVNEPRQSAAFYSALLDAEPVELSDTFALFNLQSGMRLGLWSRHTVQPPLPSEGSAAEIAFIVETDSEVDACHRAWTDKGLQILQEPTVMDFGRTFLAADPDGYRLRVYAFHG